MNDLLKNENVFDQIKNLMHKIYDLYVDLNGEYNMYRLVHFLSDEVKLMTHAKKAIENEILQLQLQINNYKKKVGINDDNTIFYSNISVNKLAHSHELAKYMELYEEYIVKNQILENTIAGEYKFLGLNTNNLLFPKNISLIEKNKLLEKEFTVVIEYINKNELIKDNYYCYILKLSQHLKIQMHFTYNESILNLISIKDRLENKFNNNKALYYEIKTYIEHRNNIIRNYNACTNNCLDEISFNFCEEYDDDSISQIKLYYYNLKKNETAKDNIIISSYIVLISQIMRQYNLKLEEVYNKFNINYPNAIYNIIPTDINELNTMLISLRMKLENIDIFSNLIIKRNKLLDSMKDFEKITVDPQRLFKSSLHLNKEEKFRKVAYPTLIKMEKEILTKAEIFNSDIQLKIKKYLEEKNINKKLFIL